LQHDWSGSPEFNFLLEKIPNSENPWIHQRRLETIGKLISTSVPFFFTKFLNFGFSISIDLYNKEGER